MKMMADNDTIKYVFNVITPDLIFDQICNFSYNKSTGVDNKCINCSHHMSSTCIYLCNLSLERFSKNRQEEENTITFRLKCIVIA